MHTLYNIGISLYGFGVWVTSLFNEKAKLMRKGWKQVFKTTAIRHDGRPIAWFHASSLGEFEQARPVLELLKRQYPKYHIWVTFFSPSGYEIRKNYAEADRVSYLPLDTPKNARKLVELIRPDIALFVKYDFWFNMLGALHQKQVPCYIFSAIFRDNQYFWKPYGKWFCKRLGCYDHLFVQNNLSVELLQSHGINKCSKVGDTRFDRVHDIAQSARQFPEVERFIQSAPVLMAGSSWEPDEEMLKRYVDGHPDSDMKLILAPHVISENHLAWIEDHFGKERCVRYSKLESVDESNRFKVLIIDNMGMLSSLYQYATVAYIGGGFGKGIHNILEALTFGKPVLFGPKWQKFQEAHEILRRQGGATYSAYADLEWVLTQWLTDKEAYAKASAACTAYVNDNLGASETILKKLKLKF